MNRWTTLARSGWIKRRPPRRLRRQTQEPGYVAWLHGHPCVCADLDPAGCDGRIEADHGDDNKGLGTRRPDCDALPMCARHHRDAPWRTREPWCAWPTWQRNEWVWLLRVRFRAMWLVATEGPRS